MNLNFLGPAIGSENNPNRVQWLTTQLRALKPKSRILDAGAGELRFKFLCGHLEYVSQDFGQYEGGGERGVNPATWDNSRLDHVCDIIDIPEKSHSFDAILCTEVFEHIPEPLLALDEFSRLIKKGGTLLLTAPFTSVTHFDPYHFFTGYSWNFYQHHLTKRGWKIVSMELSGNFYQNLAQELRRVPLVLRQDGKRTPWIFYAALLPLLWVLSRASRGQTKSDRLWPYGVFVKAVKI